MNASRATATVPTQIHSGGQSPESSEYEYYPEEHDTDNLREPNDDEWEHMRELRNEEALKAYRVNPLSVRAPDVQQPTNTRVDAVPNRTDGRTEGTQHLPTA